MWKTLDEKTLKSKKVVELREIAKTFGLQGYEKMKKADLIANLMREDPKEENSNKDDHDKSVHSRDPQPGSNHESREPRESRDNHEPREPRENRDDRFEVEGILELAEDGFGFLRFNNFLTSEKDIYVAPAQIRRFNLKTGDKIKGICRHPNDGNRFGALLYVCLLYTSRDIIRSVVTIEGSAVKLLLLPLLTLAAVAFLPIDPLIRSILVLGISFPTAATVPMLAEQEGLDAGVASKILFLSTVASIGTVPLLIHIIQLVIM